MRSISIFLFSALLCLASCQNPSEHKSASEKEETHEWSYAGETSPEHWAEIEKNSDCDGKNQSPINIIDLNVVKTDNDSNRLALLYSPETKLTKVTNNGHSIQYDFEKGDSICNQDKHFNLIQIHFHEPSEHTINGVRYPIEIHLVHQGPENQYTVIAIMGIEGTESEAIERMESYLPLKVGESKEIDRSLDLTSMFPKNKAYYNYSGSLTTPPCSEVVEWIIFKEPIVLSLEEVLKLKRDMPLDNYRDEQALNGRLVTLYTDPSSF